jgi:hypothetical protein
LSGISGIFKESSKGVRNAFGRRDIAFIGESVAIDIVDVKVVLVRQIQRLKQLYHSQMKDANIACQDIQGDLANLARILIGDFKAIWGVCGQ